MNGFNILDHKFKYTAALIFLYSVCSIQQEVSNFLLIIDELIYDHFQKRNEVDS